MTITELYNIFLEHPVVTTDSRNCPEGSIFFALKGASFDGNEYALKALELGSAYAVVDNAKYATDERCILVEDVLTTLQQLAHHHRVTLGTPVIGVTGTNGKTTTKELIAAVLSKKYNILYTQGNFNNHIGVPKTLLQLRPEHEIAVIEMGANHPGEIKTLVDNVCPDCGLITNVGKAHLEGFGSFEGVIRTKGELYDKLRATDKFAFIDAENEHLMGIVNGLRTEEYVKGNVVACDPFLRFTWQGGEVSTHLIGAYNMKNMLAAATVGLHFGVTEEQINEALSDYCPSNNRSQLTVTNSNKLIVDTYNANPTSMMAALQNFRDMQVSPKMAILGDMRELGDVSVEEHQKIINFLTDSNLTDIWLVGEEFAKVAGDFRCFANVEDVKTELVAHPIHDKYILIKGSNGIKLFQLPELL